MIALFIMYVEVVNVYIGKNKQRGSCVHISKYIQAYTHWIIARKIFIRLQKLMLCPLWVFSYIKEEWTWNPSRQEVFHVVLLMCDVGSV